VYIVSKYISLAIDANGHSIGLNYRLAFPNSFVLMYVVAAQRYLIAVTQFNDGVVTSNNS
jgi:hypothetical protein